MKRIYVVGIVLGLLMMRIPMSGAPVQVQLSSGYRVEFLGMGPVSFGKDMPGVMLKYLTTLNVDNRVALRREIDLIWARFVQDADKANVSNAMISANEVPVGTLATPTRGYNFVFRKNADWKWCIDGPGTGPGAPTQLTQQMVVQFIGLWDIATSELNPDATVLYLTPDWKGTVTKPGPDGKPVTETIDWKQADLGMRSLRRSLADYKYARTNSKIGLAPDGKSAVMESEITESLVTREGVVMHVVSSSSVLVQLINGQPLVKSSTMKFLGTR